MINASPVCHASPNLGPGRDASCHFGLSCWLELYVARAIAGAGHVDGTHPSYRYQNDVASKMLFFLGNSVMLYAMSVIVVRVINAAKIADGMTPIQILPYFR